ncbi:MAG: 4Fe-4S dicluster domain-containing protein, partial [Pseudomonadota bacterium]|nr:4Fe-4S dicluster domain-containing protein [Pseudomonadota bacterium]
PGLCGARADERRALAPRQIEAMLWRIATTLYPDLAVAPTDRTDDALAARIAGQLRGAGAGSLIVAGAALSAAGQALVHVLHERLGAVGHALDLIAPPDDVAAAGTFAELVEAMHAGTVDTLLIVDSNPAYDGPADSGFAAALAGVGFSAHLGLYRDETALLCGWHLPQSHVYEQWSDALAHDGSATLIQPAIAPLYDSRSAHELIAALIDDTERSGHALVQRQWRARASGDFETLWSTSLKSGVVAGTAFAPLRLPPARHGSPAAPAPAPATSGAIELVFVADPAVHDGSFANNGWLQELPRPFNKMTWDNALQLAPASARALGLASGDIARVGVGARTLEIPVWVQRGHAEGAASLALGYGRREAGRVGNGVGVDAYPLRGASLWSAAARIERAGKRHDFATTQHEMNQHGRELARVLAPGRAAREDEAPAPTLYPPDHPRGDHAWAMVIDLDACIGCNACTIACQAENNIPVVGRQEVARGRDMHWIRVDRYDSEEPGASVFQPVPCMHCENAPCELVCPVGATVHDSEGLNVQVYNRCIGTRFCSNNCPYKVRRFNFLQYSDTTTATLQAQRNPEVTVRQRGVMEKCTYCVQRIAGARQHAQTTGLPLVDGDVVTACQSACPTRAIHFGDLALAGSDVARLKTSPRHYALLGELNTRPRTTYLARVAARKSDTT